MFWLGIGWLGRERVCDVLYLGGSIFVCWGAFERGWGLGGCCRERLLLQSEGRIGKECDKDRDEVCGCSFWWILVLMIVYEGGLEEFGELNFN